MKSEHINQDNDWAMAPPEKLAEEALLHFKIAACKLELNRHQAHLKDKDRISLYFNSTKNRWAFYYAMCLAAYDKQLYTIKDICTMLTISRQAVNTMVQECLAEGWIELVETTSNSYRATKIITDADHKWMQNRAQRIKNSRQQMYYVDLLIIHDKISKTT